jgi:hypothetical protein
LQFVLHSLDASYFNWLLLVVFLLNDHWDGLFLLLDWFGFYSCL